MLEAKNKEEVTKLIEAGWMQKDIAKIYEVNQSSVSRYLAYHSIPHPNVRVIRADRNVLRTCRDRGLTAMETAKMSGYSYDTVQRVWSAWTKGGEMPRRCNPLTPETRVEIKKRRDQGEKMTDITQSLGVSLRSVWRWSRE